MSEHIVMLASLGFIWKAMESLELLSAEEHDQCGFLMEK